MTNDRKVRILVVGDAKTGKTSLILSLVSEEFPDIVPARSEEITIPAEVTPEKVPTYIVDYSSSEQTLDNLKDEIRRADVICIVYDVTSGESVTRLSTHWLPFVKQQTGGTKPIILIGNKDDLQHASSLDQVMPIMEQHKEVETCIECSAKQLKNISEMFYYAQKAVLYPTSPLFSPTDECLLPKCVSALHRIFRICDSNADGFLTDDDLRVFQSRCFDSQLEPDALQNIKDVIRGGSSGGLTKDGVSVDGFVFLHKVFVQRGRQETTWTVLRAFGYDDSLELQPEYVCPRFDVSSEFVVEMTLKSFEFLTQLFIVYDKDGDGVLSGVEEETLCGVSSCGVAWRNENAIALQYDTHRNITLNGFLNYWSLKACTDLRLFFTFLAENGYTFGADTHSVTSAVKMIEPAHVTSRQLFHCAVYCQSSRTVTKFLHRVGTGRHKSDVLNMMKYAVVTNAGKSLILYTSDVAPEWVDINLVIMESCDVDALESVRAVVNGIDSSRVMVAWVCDTNPDVAQIDAELVRRLDLPVIKPVGLSSEGCLPLVSDLIEAAWNPQLVKSDAGGIVLKMMLSFAVGLVAVFFTQKFFRQS